jgi:hypothetical protein
MLIQLPPNLRLSRNSLASLRWSYTMDKGQVASWIVPLVGHQFDLEDLQLWLAGQDVHVATRDDQFVLVIPSAAVGGNYKAVRAFAEDRLALINGIGRLLSPTFRPVRLADELRGVDSTGRVRETVVTVKPAEERDKAGTVRAVVQPDPREALASPLMHAASLSPKARDALIIAGRPTLTWAELYLLFELVESDVGSQMFNLGWISRSDADLFTRTANSYRTLRSHGRHGKDRGAPPANPMQHSVAVALVLGLVKAWLRHVGTCDEEHKAG